MDFLKGVLSESYDYYLEAKRKIEKRLRELPQGSPKERRIAGKKYYYLQQRQGSKVVHRYIGKVLPEKLKAEIRERKRLKVELKKIDEDLRLVRRTQGRKSG